MAFYVYKKHEKSEQITRICSVFTRIFRHIDILFIGHKGGKMFKLVSDYKPTGDQPKAIEYLSNGIKEGKKFQTLLGVTGSRKNFHNGKYYSKSAKTNISFST